MNRVACAVIVTVFWVIAVPTTGHMCGSHTFCRISELDITATSEGLSVLKQEPCATYSSIQIQRLFMGTTTIATLLINASALTNNLHLKQYHEQSILLPSAHTLEALTLQEAPQLHTITVQTNRHLKQLEITQCAISFVPPSIRNLISLRELRLKFCPIRVLNLALLSSLKYLETAQFMGNNITIIYPPQASIAQNIQTIDLSYNKVQQIDMSAFRTLKQMNNLNLAYNRLATIEYPPDGVVTLPRLTTLYLSNNKIKRISFVQLNASSMEFLELSSNRLSTMPEHIDQFPKLILLALNDNGLGTFDFASLESLSNLQRLELNNNRLRSIDLPSEVLLPSLFQLSLANNQLTSVALEQLTAPRLSLIDLSSNLLKVIPDVFEKDVNQLQYVNVMGNPLVCGTYQKYRKYIRLGILIPKWILRKEEFCSTGKYFILTSTRRVCFGLMLKFYTVATLIALPKTIHFTTLRGTGKQTSEYLQNQLTTNHALAIVERVVLVGTSVDSFIDHLSLFIGCLSFNVFYEQTLTIPGNSMLLYLTIRKAMQLKSITVSPNATLQKFIVEGCNLSSILTTVENLTQIQHLTITECGITHLNWRLFANNRLLELLNLNGNRIATISRFDTANITIKKLYLDNNPLHYLDLHRLVNLRQLQHLHMQSCNLVRLYASVPVTLSALQAIILVNNSLNTVHLVFLDAPSLSHINLSNNRIRKLPLDLVKFTRLMHLILLRNKLITFDVYALTGLTRLQSFSVQSNRLKSFTASRSVTLPHLKWLDLGSNLLVDIDTYDRWNFPSLQNILLENNSFTAVPQLHNRWPNVHLKMSYNPVTCSSLEDFVDQILYKRKLSIERVKCPNGDVKRSDLIKRNCCIMRQENETSLPTV
ncbi:protein artichoke-like [Anopheles marshallii]|uniref:protein artichoke-like n=1 Tax=Anopheles marshallii TaxID=1521116 RepID=UPI00237C1573|nr:protein artichoke-like [Anopheles marshallii]